MGADVHFDFPCLNVFFFSGCFTTDDHTRVTLAEVDGHPGSDYINANFIDVSACMCLVRIRKLLC